jgi:hypothetical protein
MHHSLKLYSGHRQWVLRFYMFWARRSRVPVLGWIIRLIANGYGRNLHHAYLLTPSEAESIMELAAGVAVGRCDCRLVSGNCNNPVEAEILLGPSRHIFIENMPQNAREITREEAREILTESHRRGLVQTVIRCRNDFYAICNCCTCCCIPLRLSKQYRIGNALVRHKDIVREFREHQLAHQE